eukprot:323270-Prymnesium_polylepis.1
MQFGQLVTLAGAAGALPAYMVPSAVVGVRVWPRTSSGKVDRKRLPSPSLAESFKATAVPPRTAAEAAMRDVFAAVLGLEAEA